MKQYAALGTGANFNSIHASAEVRKTLAASNGPITFSELQQNAVLREIAATFEAYSPSLIFPLVYRSDLIGMCVLGAPGARGPLSIDERNLLTAMGKHASLAIGSLRVQKKARAATRRLKKAEQEKQAYDEHKEDFVRITCHEFNTPLTIITLTANMLLSGDEGELNSGQTELVRQIVQNASRLSEINSDLLYLARRGLAGGDNRRLCLFEEIFTHVMERAGMLFAKRPDLEARIDIEEGMPPLRANPHDLSRALVNVIHNAIRFTPDENGLIEIKAEHKDGAIVCCVCDNGIGIEPKYHDTVFEPFVELIDKLKRSSNATRFRSSGLGLGLTITKDIIEKTQRRDIAVQRRQRQRHDDADIPARRSIRQRVISGPLAKFIVFHAASNSSATPATASQPSSGAFTRKTNERLFLRNARTIVTIFTVDPWGLCFQVNS